MSKIMDALNADIFSINIHHDQSDQLVDVEGETRFIKECDFISYRENIRKELTTPAQPVAASANMEEEIKSILSMVYSDAREAVESDLRRILSVKQDPVVSREDAREALEDLRIDMGNGDSNHMFLPSDKTVHTIIALLEAAAKETT